MIRFIYFLAAMVFFTAELHGQLPGCTDPLANNYNPAAVNNNGSCTYTATAYTPTVKVDPLSDSITETSGLQFANGYLWTINDKNGKPQLYRIDTVTNTIQQRVFLNGIGNNDWEDIAFDGSNFYIGDFGNNLTGGRTDLTIYKFPFSAIHLSAVSDTVQFSNIEAIHFIYNDQPQPVVPSGYNNTKWDCEAMVVDNNRIHLFTKNWVDNATTHYVINGTAAGSYEAQAMETYAVGYLVTAADKVPGQNIVALLGYVNSGTGNHYMQVLSDYKADSFFSGNKRRIDLGDATVMGQAEGLTFSNGKYGYISNEQFVRSVGPFTITVNQKLRSFSINDFTRDYFTKYVFTGNGNWSDANNWQYQIKPPATLYPGNAIVIDGSCTLDINYSMPAATQLTVNAGKNILVTGSLQVR